MRPQSSHRHLPPPPLSATLHASYRRALRGLRVIGDDPNASPLIFGGDLEEGTYTLARLLLRSRMFEEIVQSQAPNKVLRAMVPSPSNRPSRTTAAPVLPKCLLPAPIRRLLEAPVLPSFRRPGRRPCISRMPCRLPHGGSPLQLPHTSHGSGTGGHVGGTPPGSSILGGALTICRSAARLQFLLPQPSFPSVAFPTLAFRRDHFILTSPFQLIQWSRSQCLCLLTTTTHCFTVNDGSPLISTISY